MALMTIRPRGDIKSNWEKANPVLKQRELAFEWDNTIGVGKPRFKIGDGVTAWNNLAYSMDAAYYWDELSEENKKVLITNGSFDSIRLKTNKGSIEYDGEKIVFQKNDSGDGNTDCVIEGVADPSENNQAANKNYVDNKTQTASDTIQGTVKASEEVTINPDTGAMGIGKLLDTYGIAGDATSKQFVQDLIDAISNKVVNDLIAKNMISNVQINSNNNIPSSSLVYGMNNQISSLNANIVFAFQPYGILKGSANDIATNGMYLLTTNSTDTNGNNNGVLLSFSPNNNDFANIRLQIILRFDGQERYLRIFWYTSWTSWTQW